ncbi:hypothetical protein [Rothia mucilaginosa]|uniref:hypothetical protein n=1 Tax=Rothia mucilaginosa TaxID=43675 RepID=UPI003C737F69
MKIQEVIDEVNEAWGEEHEEKSRKIFWDNIIRKPAVIFIAVTFLYLFMPIFYYLESITFRNLELGDRSGIVDVIFNFPYRFLDLRTGIITSIASILLSLYVSVGRYAESLEGVVGDARRAAYRKFARRVGGFVFIIFIVNFWHGLLSGWLQREHFGIYYHIVPVDMDLSRYGDMPLWVLLSFGWFTAATSNMLTYNEKDGLVSKVYVLKKVNSIGSLSDRTIQVAYRVATKELDSGLKFPVIPRGKRNDASGYSALFAGGYGYSRFKFVKGPRSRGVAYWLIFLALSCIASFVYQYRGYFAFATIMILFEIAIFFMAEDYLYIGIYRLNNKYLSGVQKIYEFFDFFFARILIEIIRVAVVITIFILVPTLNDRYFLGILSLTIIFYVGRCLVAWRIMDKFYSSLEFETNESLLRSSKNLLKSEINMLKKVEKNGDSANKESDGESFKNKERHSLKGRTISLIKMIRDLLFLRRGNAGNGVDYLVLAYIYCLMLEVNKYYMDYKSELGHTDLTSNQSELIRYRYSRSTTHKAPKALRRR